MKLFFVQKRFVSIAIVALLFFTYFNSGCSKLETTDIGSDLLPAVDNIHTFDTLLTINASQGIFNLDSTLVSSTDDQILGKVTDPLFGITQANVFVQLKPTFFPFYYGNAKDTINSSLAPGTGFDSVVLCLSYKGFWGDSSVPLNLDVWDVPVNAGGLWDSLYRARNINYAPPLGTKLGSATIDIRRMGDFVKYANKKDSSQNQIRIKLSNSFANTLFGYDSVGNNPFRSDSIFRRSQNGFAITVNSGNALMYTNFADSTTKLEVHYRRKNNGVLDTTYTAFRIYTVFGSSMVAPSVSANNIIRSRSGYPVNSPAATDLYLQSQPGTYANLNIPALAGVSNRVIHHAEIIMEQVPDVTSNIFTPPNILYLELKDTSIASRWKPIYLDLNPGVNYDPDNATYFFPSGGVDYSYHGGYVRNKSDQFGNSIRYYNFNITRYVQQLVTQHKPNYQFRLSAPYKIEYPQFIGSFEDAKRAGNNRLAFGRVKLGSGSNANYRMRLRLVYSKL
ncbi:MAG: DUF4270 family protein [Ferruginibacter sp.]